MVANIEKEKKGGPVGTTPHLSVSSEKAAEAVPEETAVENKQSEIGSNIKKILDISGANLTPIDRAVVATFESANAAAPRLDRLGNPILKVDR